ncbi:hypothetical protein [Streptomyces djakartensis]
MTTTAARIDLGGRRLLLGEMPVSRAQGLEVEFTDIEQLEFDL